ncbi:MAG: MFS transporter, partial [Flavobacteriaceae bacterium]|nr:MFS transporter [Flavobacteriaceae bacterium]
GVVFLALSFIVLNMSGWTGVLIIGMLLMTLGEMIGSPFANALALSMSPKGRKGSYMGVFSMSFSLSHIIGHNSGMNLVNSFGYDTTWNIMFYVLLGVALLTLFLYRFLKKSPNFTTY